MNTFYKSALITAVTLVVLFMAATQVQADGVAKTPTPTGTPKPETRVECTTGAYGQQNCKTVVVDRVASPSDKPAHKVVNSGLAENIIFALFGLLILSSFGYTYSRVRA